MKSTFSILMTGYYSNCTCFIAHLTVAVFPTFRQNWIGPLVPSQDQPWPIPTRFSTFTPLIDPDRVGKKLADGYGPVLQQKLMLLWGKATPLLICPDTWLLEIKESKEEETIELSWTRVSYTKSILKTHTVVVQTSLSGFDVSMWLQHLVLVPQMCSDRPWSRTAGALLADSVHSFVAVVL